MGREPWRGTDAVLPAVSRPPWGPDLSAVHFGQAFGARMVSRARVELPDDLGAVWDQLEGRLLPLDDAVGRARQPPRQQRVDATPPGSVLGQEGRGARGQRALRGGRGSAKRNRWRTVSRMTTGSSLAFRPSSMTRPARARTLSTVIFESMPRGMTRVTSRGLGSRSVSVKRSLALTPFRTSGLHRVQVSLCFAHSSGLQRRRHPGQTYLSGNTSCTAFAWPAGRGRECVRVRGDGWGIECMPAAVPGERLLGARDEGFRESNGRTARGHTSRSPRREQRWSGSNSRRVSRDPAFVPVEVRPEDWHTASGTDDSPR